MTFQEAEALRPGNLVFCGSGYYIITQCDGKGVEVWSLPKKQQPSWVPLPLQLIPAFWVELHPDEFDMKTKDEQWRDILRIA